MVNLEQDGYGSITGYRDMSRLTTSSEQGVGNYFPAFFPDGNLFYIANDRPKSHPHYAVGAPEDRRFSLQVIDLEQASYQSNIFQNKSMLARAQTIGRLWRAACTPHNDPLPQPKMAWHYMSLSTAQCQDLVNNRWSGNAEDKKGLLDTCQAK